MALSYSDIRDIYDPIKSSGATTEDLPAWSARMNELTGTNSYDAGLHDNWIKRASHAIDTVINATGLPGYTEQFGRSVGELVGAPEAGAAIGHGIPRSVVNFAPLLIPGVGWAGAAARLGLTGALSGAEAYEQTGSPLSSLISGGVSAGLPGVAGKVSETTAGLLSKLVTSRAAARVGGEVAGQLAGAGVVGATQPLEQLARGEQPTSPFTVENALGLTLGQAPFAALHLASRAISGFPSLDRTIKLAQQKTNLTETKNAIEDQTGVEQIPDITPKPPPPEVSAETLKETQILLSQIRGEQIAIKDDPTLTDDQKIAQENLLSNQEYELLRQREFESEFIPRNTIFGNSIQPETPRQQLIGTELKRNKTGTWRAIHVADDPVNPEALRGKVVKYSTYGEPAPVETGQGRLTQYSIPDAQWHTVVTPEEWDSRFRKSPDTGQPELPTTGTMTAEQVSAAMNELAGIHTEVDQATTPGDLQKTIVKLGDVEQEHNFNPTNDAVLKPTVEKLADKGLNPDEATKAAVKAQASRAARKVQADAQSAAKETDQLVGEWKPDVESPTHDYKFLVTPILPSDKEAYYYRGQTHRVTMLQREKGATEWTPVLDDLASDKEDVNRIVQAGIKETEGFKTAQASRVARKVQADAQSQQGPERVVSVGVRLPDGSIIESKNQLHFQMVADLEAKGVNTTGIQPERDYGFVTNTGRFINDREEARQLQGLAQPAHAGEVIASMEAKQGERFKGQAITYTDQMGDKVPAMFLERLGAGGARIQIEGKNVEVPLDRIKTRTARDEERAVPELTSKQAAEVAAKMEGQGYSVITADKLSHAHTEDNFDTQPVKDLVTDAAVAAARTPEAQAAFDAWPGRKDTKYEKDFADFVDLIQQYGSLSKVPPKEAGQFLAARSGTVAWSPKEVKAFINRPHVQAWSRGLDTELTRMNQGVNAPVDVPNVAAPGTVSRENAPIWQPLDPRDTETMQRMGIAQGGRGMLQFLANSKNPIFSSLAQDLAKFGESLDRITGSVRQIDSGAFVKRLPGDKYEVSLSPSILRSDDYTKEFSIAHELVHGLTLSELDNPTKASIRQEFDNLRQRVIDALPKDMKSAINKALNDNWQDKWAKREVSYESLMPDGTAQQRNTLYGLLNTHEFVAQGLSENSFRQQLQSIETHVKARPGTWFNKFVNLVRTILGIGEKVSGTALEEFLSRSSQLLERGDYVSSFRNFSDRYFENLGLNRQFVNNYTQRAMGLLLSNPASSLETLDLVRSGAGAIRSPEWAAAQRDVIKMFNERGDDAVVTQRVLDETGHTPNQNGLMDLADSLMNGEVGHDAIDLLPEPAAKLVFETAKDAQNLLGVIRAATLEGNKGILNIANPELIRGVAKETLKGVDQVAATQKIHEQQTRDIQGLFSVPPDGFMHSMVSAPESVPEWMSNEPKKSVFDYFARFLEPQNQVARRIPTAAEAISKGHQLRANVRNMARESLQALGMDLETKQLTPKTVKAMFKVFQNSTLRKAADRWIATNNIEGEKQNAIKVLDADDPRIQKILTGLSPTDRGIVEDMVNKHSISTQHFQDQQLEKHLQISSTEGGQLLQRLAPNIKLNEAVGISSRLLNAFTANRNDPVAAVAADGEIQRVQGQLDPDTFLTVARFVKSAADSWTEFKNYYQQNPGWSTARAYGKYIIEFKRGNKTILDAVDSRKEAEQRAEGRPYKLTPNSEYDENKPPSLGYNAGAIADRLRQLEQNRMDILRNTGAFTEDQLKLEQQYSAAEQFITEETYRGGVPNLQPQARGLGKGAEERAWLRNHVSWIHQASNYWSRRLLRSQARAVLADPEISQNPELRDNLETHFENMMQPDTRVGKFFQRMAMMWFMGFNPASALINGTQPFLTHVAELTAMTGKPLDSYRRVLGALKEVAGSGFGHLEWKDPETRAFMSRFIKDGEADVSMFDDQAAGNELLHTNLVRMLNGDKPQTLGQKLATLNGNIATAGMWMFKTVERINAMAAGIAGYKYYRESEPNLSPDDAYAKAVEFHHSVNYGGGAANRPTGAFAGRGAFPRTVAMLATAMQSYNLGTMFQLARYIRAGFFRPEGLTPAEIHSARKAAVQMLGTQLAAAGVLGLPFVSGMLSVLNQAFPGLEVNRKLRESMDALTGGDEDNGHVLTDIGMTGAPSMFGWDFQSRLSMGNTLPGVSEINGFEPENLLGAPANLVANFIRGGQKLASGDPHAVDAFVPSALKKFEQLLRSGGQVLDYRDRPIFTPTLGEKVGIALGFNPKRLTDYNTASRIAEQADANIKARETDFHQQMAGEVLKGNFGNVRQALLQRSREDKTYDPVRAVRSIAGASEELTFPRDLRREGTLQAGDIRNRLLATFNIPPTQPSETDRYRFRQSVEQRLGLMTASPTGLQTATVMDELRRNNPTATRAELRQQMTTLSRGHRLQSLSLLEE